MNAHTMPSFTDPPFAVPADIILDAPVPPSNNKDRRINWASRPANKKWLEQADKIYLLNKRELKRQFIAGRYQITVVVDETKTRCDLDNLGKKSIDLARRYGLVVDDSPRYLRRVVIEFGKAPAGIRIILTPCE